MKYYINRTVDYSYEEAIDRAKSALKEQGFGVLSEIDLQNTLKEKLGVDVQRYQILGACNPKFAHQAMQAEDKIGVLLPCNVVVQELQDGTTEVAAMDPVAALGIIENHEMDNISQQVKNAISKALDAL